MRLVAGGLGAHAAALIRVEAEIPHKMRPGVGDVLGDLGDEVQGVEDLEVAADAAEQIGARRPGEASRDIPSFDNAATAGMVVLRWILEPSDRT